MKELRNDPELAFLERAALALSRTRLAELKTDPDYARMRKDLLAAGGAGPSRVRAANAAMQVKAPVRYRNRRKFLDRMPKGGRCAEIGVWQGSFTLEILEITKPNELVLIDPWGLLAAQEEGEWTHSKNKDREFMDRMYQDVVDEFGNNAAVNIRKGFSGDLMAEYPDGYFDWVYIDGNHLYDFVRADVEICAKKVRKGGIVAGDDFLWKRQDRLHVKEAVEDAMKVLKLPPEEHLSLVGQQFMIQL